MMLASIDALELFHKRKGTNNENDIKTRYMHSDIDSVERVEILRDLRLGVFDILVGINLLRVKRFYFNGKVRMR